MITGLPCGGRACDQRLRTGKSVLYVAPERKGDQVGYRFVYDEARPESVSAHYQVDAAIQRFARPVCYQDMPVDLLPEELRDENSALPRLVDGARA